MPAYNFKKQFAPDVEAGIKRQTIRPKRKRQTKPGEELQLYTGMRTKVCRLLIKTICKLVEPVEIHATFIKVGGRILNHKEAGEFAKADGFPSLPDFYDFFINQYGLSDKKPLTEMEVTKW
jgi:hypothetical protein